MSKPKTNVLTKINALMSIDSDLKFYIEKHRAVLLTYGYSRTEASHIIFDRIKSVSEKNIVSDSHDFQINTENKS